MFIDDILNGSKPGMQAPVFDVILFWREWGFSLRDLRPDPLLARRRGQHCPARAREGDGVAGTGRDRHRPSGREPPRRVAVAEEVLGVLLTMWDTRSPAVTVAGDGLDCRPRSARARPRASGLRIIVLARWL